MGTNEDAFERATNKTLDEMSAGAYFKAGISEAVRSMTMSNQFSFTKMLEHVTAGRKCRRALWIGSPGKYVYRAADDSSTLRTKDSTYPNSPSSVYHPTPDLFATDWELVIETCTFGEIVEHLRANGSARRLGWQDNTGKTFIQRYSTTLDDIWIHFPNGTRQKWQPYSYEFLAKDWVKCALVTSVGGVAKNVS